MFGAMARIPWRRDGGRAAPGHLRHGAFPALAIALGACAVYTPTALDQSPADDARGQLPGDVPTGGVPALDPISGAAAGAAARGDSDDAPDGDDVAGGNDIAGEGSATGSSGGASDGKGSASTGSGGAAEQAGGATGAMLRPSLLDDFEDGDIYIATVGLRTGVWFRYDDGTTGTTGPTPLACSRLVGAPSALGEYALHVTASGFSSWGSGLGADFILGREVYDISRYAGIRFWARATEGKNLEHRIQISDTTTDSTGGKCNPAADAPNSERCGNHFGRTVILTTRWAKYEVRFNAMTQLPGWGLTEHALDTAHVYGIQITTLAMADVDFWLDELEFF